MKKKIPVKVYEDVTDIHVVLEPELKAKIVNENGRTYLVTVI